MRFNFYGGAMEVGRSCIAVDDKFMFDAGLKISEEGSEYPFFYDLDKIKAVFLSHAHLDHCGALPLFNHRGLRCPIYCNAMTKETSRILMKDSLHIELLESQTPGYKKENIYNVVSLMQSAAYNRSYETGEARFTFLDAGHIPGSASILLEYKGKRILYTGDINSTDTRLLDGLVYDKDKSAGNIDVMFCESTYGDRSHPKRSTVEKDFLDQIREIIDHKGSVLIPAFAVGRAQEILMLLDKGRFNAPIYLDGMAKKVTNLYLKRPDYIKDPKLLKKALKNVRFVKNWRERKEITREMGIFVTTSGMLDGGPVIDYLSRLYHDERSAVLLTGYQAEGSNGRLLIEQRKAYIDGLRVRVKGVIKRFDFSAHSGQRELISMIKRINPRHLVLEHGDEPAIRKLAEQFQGMKIYQPRVGDSIDV